MGGFVLDGAWHTGTQQPASWAELGLERHSRPGSSGTHLGEEVAARLSAPSPGQGRRLPSRWWFLMTVE